MSECDGYDQSDVDALLLAEAQKRSDDIDALTGYVTDITSASQTETVFSDTPPPEPAEGDNWFDETTGIQYTFHETAWIQVS